MSTVASYLPNVQILERVRATLPQESSAYLVGGAVRDALLSRPIHDLDFALPERAIEVSREVARALNAAFFPLDRERDTGRVIYIAPGGERHTLDFAAFRGPDIESDLRDRDFTVNAMALSLHKEQILIDPLGGASDLRAGVLRACSNKAFLNDPVRILRGVRQAVAFSFNITPETRDLMRQAAPELLKVSPERLRDEVFFMLEGPEPATALRALEVLGVLPYVLPELPGLKGVAQSQPHSTDVYTHTLSVVQKLSRVLNVLRLQHDPESAANWAVGLISVRLGRYRQQIQDHLATRLNPDRSLESLLLLAALYHDVGKPQARQVQEDGQIRFLKHEVVGSKLAGQRARALRISNHEIERLEVIVRNHMRPLLLSQSGRNLTRRAIYRFFRHCGAAGIDVCLLSLADTLATYGPALPQDFWTSQLDVVRALLEAWWQNHEENVAPPALLTGGELIRAFDLQPGPLIGQLLEAIREAQAAGELHSREEALTLARAYLDMDTNPSPQNDQG